MGMMGLDHWQESDMASGFVHEVLSGIVKQMNKEVKVRSNEFNSSGPENIALFAEAFILPTLKDHNWDSIDGLYAVLNKAKTEMEKTLFMARGDKDCDVDIMRAYKRLHKSLAKVTKYLEEQE